MNAFRSCIILFCSVIFIFFSSILLSSNQFFHRLEDGITYPKGFLKGTSCSLYQNGGHHYWPSLGYRPKSNWTWFEEEFKARFVIDRKRENGMSWWCKPSSPIDRGERVGLSAAGWHYLFDDIKLIQELGCNAHRFELPWTDLNPEKDFWNEEAFALFDTYINALLDAGIEPIITLYHWVHPLWFHNLGAWEHEENISYFVKYCTEAFKRFGHKVRYWCTINEPTVISACGYILGTHAPGKKDYASLFRPFLTDSITTRISHNYELAARVLGNLFKAHIAVYEEIKTLSHGPYARIGIIHQKAHFKAHMHTGILRLSNPISASLATHFNKIFAHETFMHFFTTGHFIYNIPGGNRISFIDDRAPCSLDFIGLNIYSDMILGPGPMRYEHEQSTDMPMWAVRPHVLYDAITEISKLHVPIIITENGICDAQDDRREQWIISYSNAVKKTIDDGYDVRGYCYWSLLDNYEWNMGHNKKFGLYEVNTESSNLEDKIRVLRKGSYAYRDYVRIERNS